MNLKELKIKKNVMYILGAVLIGILILTLIIINNDSNTSKLTTPIEKESNIESPLPSQENTPAEIKSNTINFEQYNYQFAEKDVIKILTSMIRNEGKFAIYLPPTNYINITKESNYGIAFALNNPSPSGENYFEYEWVVDDSVIENCGVTKNMAMSWIKMGASSFGTIPKGWVDATTIYFEFPDNINPCNLKYNFKATKDGINYVSQQIEFNII